MKSFFETFAVWLTGCLVSIPMLILFMFGVNFLIAWAVMLIWNSVVVPAFAMTVALPVLGYWQTFWMTMMIKLILTPVHVNNKTNN